MELGQPAHALEHLQAGLALTESIGSCAEQSRLLSDLAKAHRLSGDWEGAKACAHRALDLAEVAGRPYDERLARRILDRLEVG